MHKGPARAHGHQSDALLIDALARRVVSPLLATRPPAQLYIIHTHELILEPMHKGPARAHGHQSDALLIDALARSVVSPLLATRPSAALEVVLLALVGCSFALKKRHNMFVSINQYILYTQNLSPKYINHTAFLIYFFHLSNILYCKDIFQRK